MGSSVTFLPSGRELELDADTSLLQACQDAGIPIATVCGGRASCTECKVQVMEGEEHLSPMEFEEESKLGNTFFITKERLACQTKALGPLVVKVLKEETRDKRERGRERALKRSRENLDRHNERRRSAEERRSATGKSAERRRSTEPDAAQGSGAGQARGSSSRGQDTEGRGDGQTTRRRRRRSRRGAGEAADQRRASSTDPSQRAPQSGESAAAESPPGTKRRRRRRRRSRSGSDANSGGSSNS